MSNGVSKRADETRRRVGELLTGPLLTLGLDVEAVEITPAGNRRVLRIAVDGDGGVSLDQVAEATREVSRVLDEDDVMGEQPYTLEVTSRGVDRPLTLARHWRRNADRLVSVTTTTTATIPTTATTEGSTVTGRIVDSDETSVRLDVDGSELRLPYDEIARAVVQIELNPRRRSVTDDPGLDEDSDNEDSDDEDLDDTDDTDDDVTDVDTDDLEEDD